MRSRTCTCGGKMPQQWVSMGDIIWDSDISPEGLSVTYKYPLSGSTELFGSAGHYTLKDNVDGEGKFKHDLRLYAGQLGGRFALTDNLKMTLGGSIYAYDNADSSACPGTGTVTAPCASTATARVKNSTVRRLWSVDVSGLPVPLSFYGQYVNNTEASNSQDTGWLAGVKTKVYGFAIDYNYRDVQQNAVVGAFTDSDFANGFTGSRGSKLKVSYELDKNFNVGATYYMANLTTPTPASTRKIRTSTPCNWMPKPSSDSPPYDSGKEARAAFTAWRWFVCPPSSVRWTNASLCSPRHPFRISDDPRPGSGFCSSRSASCTPPRAA
jgi:hypothetical protein